MAEKVVSSTGQSETQRRITEQRAVVASLAADTPQNRIASQILLMLEQMLETEQAIAALKAKVKDNR